MREPPPGERIGDLRQALRDIKERAAQECDRAQDRTHPYPSSVVQFMFATIEAMTVAALEADGGEG